jgi:hypothetical protein
MAKAAPEGEQAGLNVLDHLTDDVLPTLLDRLSTEEVGVGAQTDE